MWCHITSSGISLLHVMSYHILWYFPPSCDVISHPPVFSSFMWCHITSGISLLYVISYHILRYFPPSCDVISHPLVFPSFMWCRINPPVFPSFMWCHITSGISLLYVISYHILRYFPPSCDVISHPLVFPSFMWCHITSSDIFLLHVMSYHILWYLDVFGAKVDMNGPMAQWLCIGE